MSYAASHKLAGGARASSHFCQIVLDRNDGRRYGSA